MLSSPTHRNSITTSPTPTPTSPVPELTEMNDDETNKENFNGLLPEELVEVPTFLNTPACDAELCRVTRELLRKRYDERPDSFYKFDVDLILNDDWAVSRFLLRCRLDPERSVDLMEASSKFRKQFKMGETQLAQFPSEIHQVGGIFQYAPDRVGNTTLWMRAKMHRRCSEMTYIMKQFILCVMEQCDKSVGGRGVAVVFDLSECGLKNADPTFLFWLLNSFRNYCPKGLSYILVYNLPWVLNATCSIALSWLSSTNKRRLRFIEGEQIKRFIAPANLPDFIPGGECKRDYKCVPQGAAPVKPRPEDDLIPISDELADKIREINKKWVGVSV